MTESSHDTKTLITLLNKKCKSSNGFMGVEVNNAKTNENLFENIVDEIVSITETIEYSDIQEEFGMSEREAKGYVKKLKNFILEYAPNEYHNQIK